MVTATGIRSKPRWSHESMEGISEKPRTSTSTSSPTDGETNLLELFGQEHRLLTVASIGHLQRHSRLATYEDAKVHEF